MTEHAPAKINAFLKVTGKRGSYHEIVSRFIKIDALYDTISFQEHQHGHAFELVGDFNCTMEKNSIYKAYIALKHVYSNPKPIEQFFKSHRVLVHKNIPTFAGLGGGSSDAATFLKMANRYLKLGLSQEFLAIIGAKVGADVPFFIYEYHSANVEGIGEVVTPFEEEALKFHIFTPDHIACDTAKVFQHFSTKFYKTISQEQKLKLKMTPTHEVLKTFSTSEANDLFLPARDLYPELNSYDKEGLFFSGSGSSFFSREF